MNIDYSNRFKKQYKKLSSKLKKQLKDRVDILIENEFDVILNNHKLHGKFAVYRSININSDIRLVYKREKDNFYLLAIGTHSELYE